MTYTIHDPCCLSDLGGRIGIKRNRTRLVVGFLGSLWIHPSSLAWRKALFSSFISFYFFLLPFSLFFVFPLYIIIMGGWGMAGPAFELAAHRRPRKPLVVVVD